MATLVTYSLVIPVYRNEGSIPELLEILDALNAQLDHELEVVFVVDGSPDASYRILGESLPKRTFSSQLLLLARNFGSFAAVRAGLKHAHGKYFAVMAADLQEPPELVLQFFESIGQNEFDVVVGTREAREDPFLQRVFAGLHWFLYRKFIQTEVPPGGVDVFGCNKVFREHLLSLEESNSTLVGLLFWMGFRRKVISYRRLARRHGTSAWSLPRKLRYLADSAFAFSDLPIRLLILAGAIGVVVSVLLSITVIVAKLAGYIDVPGYAATILALLFFAAINTFGLGIIGSYVWRAFENTKGRPLWILQNKLEFSGHSRDT